MFANNFPFYFFFYLPRNISLMFGKFINADTFSWNLMRLTRNLSITCTIIFQSTFIKPQHIQFQMTAKIIEIEIFIRIHLNYLRKFKMYLAVFMPHFMLMKLFCEHFQSIFHILHMWHLLFFTVFNRAVFSVQFAKGKFQSQAKLCNLQHRLFMPVKGFRFSPFSRIFIDFVAKLNKFWISIQFKNHFSSQIFD